MKKSISLLATIAVLAPVTTGFAQSSWQTVADFQCAAPATVDALAKDPAGNLYAAISTSDAESRMHAVIRKSSDHGATWSVVEDFVYGARDSVRFLRLGADAAGHLYAAGYAEDNRQTRWIVRKSEIGGNSWSTVDDLAWPGCETTVPQGFAVDVAGNLYVAGYGAEPTTDAKSGRRAHWLVRQSRDGGRNWSTIDDFSYDFSAKAFAIVSTSNGLFIAGSGWNGKRESGGRWLVRKGTPDGAGGFRWQTVDELQRGEHGQWSESRASALAVDVRGSLYAVGRSYAPPGGRAKAHWLVRRASHEGLNWTDVDTFQLEPDCFAAAWGIAANDRGGVFVVGQAADGNNAAHWIVRQSLTGEPGTWSVSDDFRLAAPPPSTPTAAGLINRAADGTVTATSPGNQARGVAILSDSAFVFAGGLANAGPGHAIVRKLKFVRAGELTAASGR